MLVRIGLVIGWGILGRFRTTLLSHQACRARNSNARRPTPNALGIRNFFSNYREYLTGSTATPETYEVESCVSSTEAVEVDAELALCS